MSVVKWLENQISKSSGPRSSAGRGEYEFAPDSDVNQGNKETRWAQDFLVRPHGWIVFLDLLQAVENRVNFRSVVWGCVEFTITGKSEVKILTL